MNELTVVPPFPTVADEVYLITSVTLSQDGDLLSSTYVSGNELEVKQCYHWCCLMTTPTIRDTISLGTFQAGSHVISIGMYQSASEVACEAEVLMRDTIVAFTIYGPNGVGIVESAKEVQLYPNPCAQSVTLSCAQPINSVDLWDAAGRLLFAREILNEQSLKVDMSGLSPGSYIMLIYTAQGCQRKKVLKY